MTERYQARRDTVAGAFHLLQGLASATAPTAPAPPPPTPAVADAAPTPVADDRPLLDFQSLRVKGAGALSRARVPGGWLVSTAYAVTFVPDPQHEWDGGSVA